MANLRSFLLTARWLVGLVVLLPGSDCPPLTPLPKPAAGSWLVFLCKAADASDEPHQLSYYEELFQKDQPDLLFAYFDAVSNQTVDISGSQVHGWFTMKVNKADIAPDVRNNGKPVTRTQTAEDCKTAALTGIINSGKSIDPNDYVGVLTVINVPVDVGAAGGKYVVLSEHAEKEIGFIAHEMLHVYGLDHSYTASADVSADHVWNHGGDAEYGDCWDMMSFRTCTYWFQSSRGPQGPELQAAYRERLKWLPADRVSVKSMSSPPKSTITLAPLSDPTKPGFLLAKIELPSGWYVVEYREKSRFDRGILQSAVVIREQRYVTGKTFLVKRQNGNIGWQKGDIFTDAGNWVSVSVDDIVSGAATVTINTGYSTGPGQLNEMCGDKYRGEVITCAAGLRCGPRRHPPLVTIDYFCQP